MKVWESLFDSKSFPSNICYVLTWWDLCIWFLQYKKRVFLEEFGYFIFILGQFFDTLLTKFWFNLVSKWHVGVIHSQAVLVHFIKRWEELPGSHADAFEIFDFVGFVTINQFTKNVFAYSDKWFFDIFDVQGQVLYRTVEQNCMEITILELRVQSLIDIIVQLDVEHIIVFCRNVI